MKFNRAVIASEGGSSGKLLAKFLRIGENEEIDLAKMQEILYDRLYRLGIVRNLDGTRAKRKRKRDREAAKRRRRSKR